MSKFYEDNHDTNEDDDTCSNINKINNSNHITKFFLHYLNKATNFFINLCYDTKLEPSNFNSRLFAKPTDEKYNYDIPSLPFERQFREDYSCLNISNLATEAEEDFDNRTKIELNDMSYFRDTTFTNKKLTPFMKITDFIIDCKKYINNTIFT